MPRRSSPREVEDLGDLSHLGELVVDKRFGQRSSAKKNRRNRHYEKQFIRNVLTLRTFDPANGAADGRTEGDAGGREGPRPLPD